MNLRIPSLAFAAGLTLALMPTQVPCPCLERPPLGFGRPLQRQRFAYQIHFRRLGAVTRTPVLPRPRSATEIPTAPATSVPPTTTEAATTAMAMELSLRQRFWRWRSDRRSRRYCCNRRLQCGLRSQRLSSASRLVGRDYFSIAITKSVYRTREIPAFDKRQLARKLTLKPRNFRVQSS
jgi:hypothetical protein